MIITDYKQAGVDIEEGYRAVAKYREFAQGTARKAVLNGLGSFAGMFSLAEFVRAGEGMEEPVLVSGADGVGTKLEIAFRMKKYDTVGIDCVAMCVNDIVCHGARPLFFLDYLACGKLDADVAAELVKGVATGCRETGSALLGGETAEMPGFYETGKYDLAGFSVGIVDRKKIIDGAAIREGDALVGIASSGPHSNGYSLIRKLLPDLDEDFGGMPIGMALLEPTRLYARAVLGLLPDIRVRGMAHITGGGFYENIPRMFARDASPEAFDAVIDRTAWKIPPVFARLAASAAGTGLTGKAAEAKGAELLAGGDTGLTRLFWGTFNMGIGFVLALPSEEAETAIERLDGAGFPAWTIGRVARAGDAGTVRFVR
ncbi:MAG: phosphoribosylformylglycinamidine cyclo-ligase [Spirochaetaceae bacterium]|jgi:phosphoribosylformylglycinamidine cyclo-ligase|nr:phosphoribosylformylglycinamidine cyclo-ligase [Spirochaetaceae bacterium]